MIVLMYSTIKKNLNDLYVERNIQGLTIDQYIGRSMYEYERVLDADSNRNIESFFFYLAMWDKLSKIYSGFDLRSVFPEGVQSIEDYKVYEMVLKCADINETDVALIQADYKKVVQRMKEN